ncbi:MAG: hypothetical protein DLM69_09810, partial [Candidatus Chloroheliales bacterium]
MSDYTFTDALGYSMEQLVEMVNRCYKQSYLPLQQTPLELARYCQYNNMDLGSIVVMFDGDNFVGCSLLATRNRRGWLGGFGIVPEYRGRGAGRAMLTRQLAVARTFGLTQLQLEVPLQSTPAPRLGESAGFESRRDVFDLLLATKALPHHASTASISPANPEQIMDLLLQGQQPAWTRERINLLVKGGEAIVLSHASGATAAMMYRRRGSHGEKVQLYAAALSNYAGANDFALMLRHAADSATSISIHNE